MKDTLDHGRMVPDQHRHEIFYGEHVARYRLAARWAPGRRILDVASGSGYGSAILARAGAVEVVGLDRSSTAVRHSQERYAAEGARFEVGDALRLPFDDGRFDLVVSFETIEHLSAPHQFLDEVRRVLARPGLALVSTPNPREYPAGNPHHVSELSRRSFVDAMQSRFDSVQLLYQRNRVVAEILTEADCLGAWPSSTAVEVLSPPASAEHALYFVAVATVGGPLPALQGLSLLSDDEPLRVQERVAARLAQIAAGSWLLRWYRARSRLASWWRRGVGRR